MDREGWACNLSEHVFRWPIHPTPERCTLQHRKLSHSAAETSPVLRSCLVSESSECIEFWNNISILMTGCSVRLWPALLPQFLKEQMTQWFELRANGDLYLCMTCFRSPGGGGPRSHMPVGGKVVQHRRQNLCSSGSGEANVINSRRWRDQISLLLQTASLQTVVAAAEGHKCDWTHQWPRIHRGNVTIKDPAWDLNLYQYSIVSCIYVYIHWSGHPWPLSDLETKLSLVHVRNATGLDASSYQNHRGR